MSSVAPTISEAFATMAELADVLGIRDIKDLPGMWEVAVDDHWAIRVNGHEETLDSVPPYHMAVVYNGFPAGIIGPRGGWMTAGLLANENNFIAALRARIDKEQRR